MTRRQLSVAIATAAALVGGQVHAQECISEKQIESLAIYAMPSIVEGVRTKCVNQLGTEGFLAQSGDAFAQPYSELRDDRWPQAKAAFLVFAAKGEEADEGDDLLASLPDEAVRPLFDMIIAQKVGEEVKPSDCQKVERALELIAPLPPENTGGLIALLAGLVGVDDPPVCK